MCGYFCIGFNDHLSSPNNFKRNDNTNLNDFKNR